MHAHIPSSLQNKFFEASHNNDTWSQTRPSCSYTTVVVVTIGVVGVVVVEKVVIVEVVIMVDAVVVVAFVVASCINEVLSLRAVIRDF
jgi:hypothetical protein